MRDLGDFQTPPALVAAVLHRLCWEGVRWDRVLEPTCGQGNFLAGLLALESPPREIFGVEIQPEHFGVSLDLAQRGPSCVQVQLIERNFFEIDLKTLLGERKEGCLLVVGNPPWVTNAALGVLGSPHRPTRVNHKAARGLVAKTGESNFDMAEAIWLKLLTELAELQPTIALLCKTSVARKVLEHARRTGLSVRSAAMTQIDARAWFGAAVEACLLQITLGGVGERFSLDQVPIFSNLEATKPSTMMGFARGRLVADMGTYSAFAFAEGTCPMVWRQGLKHDAADLMELEQRVEPNPESGISHPARETFWNKRGEPAELELEYVFPLLKGADLARTGPIAPRRFVIMTQRFLGEDTARLHHDAPCLWRYLQAHEAAFQRRKSSIYRGRPPFAMFGIGPYCFAPFKVAISGLHKAPVFHAVGSAGVSGAQRPVMLDDTCYFLACRSAEQAALVSSLLNSSDAVGLLRALMFSTAKRPITKGLLQRLDLFALLGRADLPLLLENAGVRVQQLTGRAPTWPSSLGTLLLNDPTPGLKPSAVST
ncbi:MAG: class I SAM-dependent methyltransferase [Isosphaeraceae bacterium]